MHAKIVAQFVSDNAYDTVGAGKTASPFLTLQPRGDLGHCETRNLINENAF